MSIPITRVDTPSWLMNIKATYPMTPHYITVHNTANNASAMAEISYMLSNSNYCSYHFAVDDYRAVQGLPLDRNGWHAGDGQGQGNRNSIGIEICYSTGDINQFLKAERNGAKLVAQLLKAYGWGIDRVRKHQDWSGKYCPHKTLDLGWQRFIDMVKEEMESEEINMKKLEELERRIAALEGNQKETSPSDWARQTWENGKQDGLTDGTRPRAWATREELIAVVERFKEKFIGK